jgi:hypothetical protein
MDHDTYMVKLAGIRSELYEAHLEAVRNYLGSTPEEALGRIIATYEPIKKFDQIIDAEKLKRPPPAKPKLG